MCGEVPSTSASSPPGNRGSDCLRPETLSRSTNTRERARPDGSAFVSAEASDGLDDGPGVAHHDEYAAAPFTLAIFETNRR